MILFGLVQHYKRYTLA